MHLERVVCLLASTQLQYLCPKFATQISESKCLAAAPHAPIQQVSLSICLPSTTGYNHTALHNFISHKSVSLFIPSNQVACQEHFARFARQVILFPQTINVFPFWQIHHCWHLIHHFDLSSMDIIPSDSVSCDQ